MGLWISCWYFYDKNFDLTFQLKPFIINVPYIRFYNNDTWTDTKGNVLFSKSFFYVKNWGVIMDLFIPF